MEKQSYIMYYVFPDDQSQFRTKEYTKAYKCIYLYGLHRAFAHITGVLGAHWQQPRHKVMMMTMMMKVV